MYFRYTYDGTPLSVNLNGGEYYYIVDPQGNITGLMDGVGRLMASYTYDAWGNVISIDGVTPDIAQMNPLRYRDYFFDSETGLYYTGGKYYIPNWGCCTNEVTSDMTSSNLFAV